jgi:hypothetical protein
MGESQRSLNDLAVLYRVQGRYADAEPLYKRSLAIREKARGANHPHVAPSLNSVARPGDKDEPQAAWKAASPRRSSLSAWRYANGTEIPHRTCPA